METTESAVMQAAAPDCEHATFGASDYQFCYAARTHAEAQAVCESAGLAMVRIDGPEENAFVHLRLGYSAWLGSTDATTEGNWRWQIGDELFWQGTAAGAAVGGAYTNWVWPEPNDKFGGEDCGEIRLVDGRWNDLPCTDLRPSVCESIPDSNGPPPPDTACRREQVGDATYWLCDNLRPWDEARDRCRAVGMDLVAFDDAGEAAFVSEQLATPSHIGLNDIDSEGAWRWSASRALTWCGEADGAPVGDAFTAWHPAYPLATHACTTLQGDGVEYSLCEDGATWAGARAACEAAGLSLARVDSAAHNALLASAGSGDVWIGASDQAAEGAWQWTDGTAFWSGRANGTSLGGEFSAWAGGEPNNWWNEDCAVLDASTSTWNDEPCGMIHAFACEGPLDAGPPDIVDCAWVLPGGGGAWRAGACGIPRAYACENVARSAAPLDVVATAIRVQYDSGRPAVGHVDIPAAAGVMDPFTSDGDRFGLRACIDDMAPVGAPVAVPSEGIEVERVAQRYRGVEVEGRGYVVERDLTTRAVVRMTGQVAHDLSVDVTPSVPEDDALSIAASSLGVAVWELSPAPAGTLVIAPTRQAPTAADWALAWSFFIPTTGQVSGATVFVRADTGEVVSTAPVQVQACTSVDMSQVVSPTQAADIDVEAYQHTLWGDPTSTRVTEVLDPSVSAPYLLSSAGIPGVAPGPTMVMSCPGHAAPDVVALSTSAVSVSATSGENEHAAAFYLAMQQCFDYLATDMKRRDGDPWIGIDGTGAMLVQAMVMPVAATMGAWYNTELNMFGVEPSATSLIGSSVEIACHEVGHALLANLGHSYANVEAAAVAEGFGDIVGAAAEMSVRGYPGDGGFCMVGDNDQNLGCLRDMAHPENTRCEVYDSLGQRVIEFCPSGYNTPYYCPYAEFCSKTKTDSCCDPHGNSNVLGHWFYLIANGSSGVNGASCSYTVPPLNPDLDVAVSMAATIAFVAARDYYIADGGFPAFADATITAAKTLFPNDDQVRVSVAAAWYAVNVRENFTEADNTTVSPRREQKDGSPWIAFRWSAPNDERWDVQLTNRSFDPLDVIPSRHDFLHDWTDITPMRAIDPATGVMTAELRVALPANSQRRYYWRVRPHSANPWDDCEPIHSFVGTGDEPAPTVFVSTPVSPGAALIKPGRIALSWGHKPGTNGYHVSVSTTDTACAGGDVANLIVTEDALNHGEIPGLRFGYERVDNIQPESHYWVHMQALGPPDLQGNPTMGPCVAREFDTAKMRAPTLLDPDPDPDREDIYGYHSPHTQGMYGPPGAPLAWRWIAYGGTARSIVRFYRRTATGCETAQAGSDQVVVDRCETDVCSSELTADVFPTPHPAGYCWTVTAVADNGRESEPSAVGKFRYWVDAPSGTPGVDHATNLDDDDPGALPGDSYGKPVTIDWDPIPGVVGYRLVVADWTFGTYGIDAVPADRRMIDQTYGPGVTSAVFSAGPVTRGRYSWIVQPLMPDGSGNAAAIQPALRHLWMSYTTGPAKPRFEIDGALPPSSGFTAAPITGRIMFDYVPDRQWEWTGTSGVEFGPGTCLANVHYSDLTDCPREFTITPTEGTTYTMHARTWNTVGPGAPSFDDATKVHDEVWSWTNGMCGNTDETCCPGQSCDRADLFCNGQSECQDCGGLNEVCCPTSGCESGRSCDGGICKSCGGRGQECCSGRTCHNSGVDECVGSGAGVCQQSAEACNSTVQAGGDDPETLTVELGATSGTTRFRVNTFSVPDNITVTYEGTLLAQPGCFGTADTLNACNVNGWCCNGGECWVDVAYSGSSSQMTVQVYPNCSGTADTAWEFSLSCP